MKTAIVWFRRDLRLDDNPALLEAVEHFDYVIPLYIHEPLNPDQDWPEGSATRWWLHHSLKALDERLDGLGGKLLIRMGRPLEILEALLSSSGAVAVFWNRRYSPQEIARDTQIKAALKAQGVKVETFNSALLREPWIHLKSDGRPYRVFTPFWKAYLGQGGFASPEPPPSAVPFPSFSSEGVHLTALELLPKIPWDAGFSRAWTPGEASARMQLDHFLNGAIERYADERDIPASPGTSRLSPHLHFGEISPRRIAAEIASQKSPGNRGCEVFLKELGWREFAYHLLYHFPETARQPMDLRFDRFPWRDPEPETLVSWQQGRTGFPIIDAGMRELWQTGWMHNRVRMIVASFLTKNLLIHWLKGAEWFWDTLVDADLASNTLGWQWTAGSGADAAPYFRIFNPLLQGEKFDPSGAYVRRWVPEISHLPDRWVHRPFEMPEAQRLALGFSLGVDYPRPLVDLGETRTRALEAFKGLKELNSELKD